MYSIYLYVCCVQTTCFIWRVSIPEEHLSIFIHYAAVYTYKILSENPDPVSVSILQTETSGKPKQQCVWIAGSSNNRRKLWPWHYYWLGILRSGCNTVACQQAGLPYWFRFGSDMALHPVASLTAKETGPALYFLCSSLFWLRMGWSVPSAHCQELIPALVSSARANITCATDNPNSRDLSGF